MQRNRQHGRVEIRAYWWVEADQEMRTYLEQELGWPQVRWYGRVKRRRSKLFSGRWSEEEVVWTSRKRRRLLNGRVVTGRSKTASSGY